MPKKRVNKASYKREKSLARGADGGLKSFTASLVSEPYGRRNGSKKLAPVARKEGAMRFVHLTLDKSPSPPAFGPEYVRSIVCLNLGEFGPSRAIRWVREAAERRLHEPNVVVPSIVVIGSTADMSPEQADKVEDAIVDAGAVFFETTENSPTFDAALEELRKEMGDVYEGAEQDEAGYFTLKGADNNGALKNGHKAAAPRRSQPDLSPYFDESHQISDEDFELLTQRTDLPDDSPEFED